MLRKQRYAGYQCCLWYFGFVQLADAQAFRSCLPSLSKSFGLPLPFLLRLGKELMEVPQRKVSSFLEPYNVTIIRYSTQNRCLVS